MNLGILLKPATVTTPSGNPVVSVLITWFIVQVRRTQEITFITALYNIWLEIIWKSNYFWTGSEQGLWLNVMVAYFLQLVECLSCKHVLFTTQHSIMRVVLFSVMSVCGWLCLFVFNIITCEPLEISSQNFQSKWLHSGGWLVIYLY